MVMIVVSSFMVGAVYYFLTRGVEVSGLEKRYQTAREASLGGIDVFTKEVIPLAITNATLSSIVGGFSSISAAQVQAVATDTCFSGKILHATSSWPTGCDNALSAKTNPDVIFTLSGVGAAQPFNVYTKIVDTVTGNSDTSGVLLEGQGVAETQTGMITVQHFPYMYRVEIQGERQTNPQEKAGFSLLYAY